MRQPSRNGSRGESPHALRFKRAIHASDVLRRVLAAFSWRFLTTSQRTPSPTLPRSQARALDPRRRLLRARARYTRLRLAFLTFEPFPAPVTRRATVPDRVADNAAGRVLAVGAGLVSGSHPLRVPHSLVPETPISACPGVILPLTRTLSPRHNHRQTYIYDYD